jgi:hypothetical protein
MMRERERRCLISKVSPDFKILRTSTSSLRRSYLRSGRKTELSDSRLARYSYPPLKKEEVQASLGPQDLAKELMMIIFLLMTKP